MNVVIYFCYKMVEMLDIFKFIFINMIQKMSGIVFSHCF